MFMREVMMEKQFIHYAVINNRTQVLKYLLEHFSDTKNLMFTNKTFGSRLTALDFAKEPNVREIAS